MEINGSLLFVDEPIPFDIPPIDDFPVINVLKKEKLIELNKRMEHIKISDEELLDGDDEECAYEHIKGIIENIKYCIKNNLEMINFCH